MYNETEKQFLKLLRKKRATMLNIWIKTAGIIFVIVIGYLMKKTGAFPASTAKTLSKLSINILLPFVYICNLNGLTLNGGLLSALLWGLGVNLVLLNTAFFLGRKKPKDVVFILMYCIPCFNVTGFAVPVLQLFASEYEVASLIMFNIPITFSFFILVPILLQLNGAGEHDVSLKSIGRKLLSNVAAVTSLVMVLLCVLKLSLPDVLITAFRPLANANTAIALLALGLLFEFPKGLPKLNLAALIVRVLITAAAAALVLFDIIPFGTLKKAMIIVLFAPIPSASPAMALTQGFEGSEIAFGVSTNLILSVICMTILCSLLF